MAELQIVFALYRGQRVRICGGVLRWRSEVIVVEKGRQHSVASIAEIFGNFASGNDTEASLRPSSKCHPSATEECPKLRTTPQIAN